MKVDIICPLYNATKYISNLHDSFLMQKNVDLNAVIYVVTNTNDGIENILAHLSKCRYSFIEQSEFSHSLTREKAIYSSDADIVALVSQDVVIESDMWLYNLIKPIVEKECQATYSRQLCNDSSIEKYTREYNYPAQERLLNQSAIQEYGLKAFSLSDVSAAIDRNTFVQLGGYDQKDLIINEDMYYAYKLITSGYSVKYCPESELIHFHHYTLQDLFKRYYQVGQFFANNPVIYQTGAVKSGGSLAKYILKRALQDRNYGVLLRYIPDMASRYLGMKFGQLSVR